MPDLVPDASIAVVQAARLDAMPMLLPGSQVLHHIYASRFTPDSFNPGLGSGRFHPFQNVSGQIVPVYYAATTEEGSYCETLFRAVGDGLQACSRVAGKLISNYSYARIRLRRSLTLALLSGNELRRLGLTRAALLEPGPLHYAQTAAWAAAIHAVYPHLHGLAWVSRQHDSSSCIMIFGDRVKSDQFEVLSSLDLGTTVGQARADVVAHGLGIVITR